MTFPIIKWNSRPPHELRALCSKEPAIGISGFFLPCPMLDATPNAMAMAKRQVVSRGSVSSCPGVWVSSSQEKKPKRSGGRHSAKKRVCSAARGNLGGPRPGQKKGQSEKNKNPHQPERDDLHCMSTLWVNMSGLPVCRVCLGEQGTRWWWLS